MTSDLNLFGCIDTIFESDVDDDNYSGADSSVVLERRRKSHIEAEQRRRNAIKGGYETLRELVYPIKSNVSSTRLSKLLILNKAISEIKMLVQEVNRKNAEVCSLEKIVGTLKITTSFYRNQLRSVTSLLTSTIAPMGEGAKLKIFESVSDQLFAFFTSNLELQSFESFAEAFLKWLEELSAAEVICNTLQSVLPKSVNMDAGVSQSTSGVTIPEISSSIHCSPSFDFHTAKVSSVDKEKDLEKLSNNYASHRDTVSFRAFSCMPCSRNQTSKDSTDLHSFPHIEPKGIDENPISSFRPDNLSFFGLSSSVPHQPVFDSSHTSSEKMLGLVTLQKDFPTGTPAVDATASDMSVTRTEVFLNHTESQSISSSAVNFSKPAPHDRFNDLS